MASYNNETNRWCGWSTTCVSISIFPERENTDGGQASGSRSIIFHGGAHGWEHGCGAGKPHPRKLGLLACPFGSAGPDRTETNISEATSYGFTVKPTPALASSRQRLACELVEFFSGVAEDV